MSNGPSLTLRPLGPIVSRPSTRLRRSGEPSPFRGRLQLSCGLCSIMYRALSSRGFFMWQPLSAQISLKISYSINIS